LAPEQGDAVSSGTNRFIVTHNPNITAAFPKIGVPVADGEALVFGPGGKGGATIVARIKIEEWPSLRPYAVTPLAYFPVAIPQKIWDPDVAFTQECLMAESKLDLLQGTLDLMVLQTLVTMGSMHGYGIARRIEQVSGDEILLNQGTIYASLVRLQQRGWIAAEWGTSDNNRKAKYYSITRGGRKQLAEDAAHWHRLSRVMGRVLAMPAEGEL
jgi:PadR family transcriptional regulator, regulatory protein PadR